MVFGLEWGILDETLYMAYFDGMAYVDLMVVFAYFGLDFLWFRNC